MELDIRIRSISNGYIVTMDTTDTADSMGVLVETQEEEETYFSSIESAYQYVIVKLYKLKDGDQEPRFLTDGTQDFFENEEEDEDDTTDPHKLD